jgi:hypothetical protein
VAASCVCACLSCLHPSAGCSPFACSARYNAEPAASCVRFIHTGCQPNRQT